jgi:two-component system phosphate regulon sensor histidine kinase PhoR
MFRNTAVCRIVMSKRYAYLIAAGLLLFALVLLLSSFAARAAVAGLILVGTVIWLGRVFLRPQPAIAAATGGETEPDEESSPETFALGKLFAATMSGMREGLLVVDQDMRVVASNKAAHQLFQFSEGRLNTQRLTELTRNPALYSAFLDGLKGIERSGVRVETHGPERLVFDLRVVPLGKTGRSTRVSEGTGSSGLNGKATTTPAAGALGVFIDVTRNERLETVRQEFLSNVSHELRTPLTAILAFVETLETGALEDQESVRRFLAIIRKNATRMETLIADILELSAIEAGNVTVTADAIPLAPLVDEVLASLGSKAAEHRVTLSNLVARDAIVFADPGRLEQMLTNLVENAIKFNRNAGQVEVGFEARGRSPGDGKGSPPPAGDASARDRISVRDTGEGIPSQHLERLFERFYRVDRARSRALGGTGLALALVKHLARAHGGEVTVSSELGKGTVFTIELPPPADRVYRPTQNW